MVIKDVNRFLIGIVFVMLSIIFPNLKKIFIKPTNILPITMIYSNLFNIKEYDCVVSYEYIKEVKCDDGYLVYTYNENVRSDVSGVCIYKNNTEVSIMDYDGKICEYKLLDKVYIRLYQYVYQSDIIAKASYDNEYYYLKNEN